MYKTKHVYSIFLIFLYCYLHILFYSFALFYDFFFFLIIYLFGSSGS